MELEKEFVCFDRAASFSLALFGKILASLENRFFDNGQLFYQLGDKSVQEKDIQDLSCVPVVPYGDVASNYGKAIQQEILYKSFLFSLLADEASREKLVCLGAYAVLGHTRVKLPYYREGSVEIREELLKKFDVASDGEERLLQAVREKWKTDVFSLYRHEMDGVELKTYTIGEELYRRHCCPSYECATERGTLSVSRGDVVLDCGAAFGDISLQFAQAAGEAGRVICFEPYPLFAEVFQANMAMNSALAKPITLVDRAVWNESDVVLSFIEGGGGSRIDQRNKSARKIVTTKIDDTVKDLSLPRVDFIKMDIEGAEFNALLGAKETVFAHRPKLAICLYHNPKDFHEIPRLIDSWGLGYKFYLNHHYMNQWETVLYAVADR